MKAIKAAAVIMGVLALFVVGAIVESHVRSLARAPIAVVAMDDVPAKVAAYAQPDFLWIGEAWWITIRSDVPVHLEVDGEWDAFVSSGTNTIFYSHDSNNTASFGTNRWWKAPSKITVKAWRR